MGTFLGLGSAARVWTFAAWEIRVSAGRTVASPASPASPAVAGLDPIAAAAAVQLIEAAPAVQDVAPAATVDHVCAAPASKRVGVGGADEVVGTVGPAVSVAAPRPGEHGDAARDQRDGEDHTQRDEHPLASLPHAAASIGAGPPPCVTSPLTSSARNFPLGRKTRPPPLWPQRRSAPRRVQRDP